MEISPFFVLLAPIQEEVHNLAKEAVITFSAITDDDSLIQFAAQANQLLQIAGESVDKLIIDISQVCFVEPPFLVSLAAVMAFAANAFEGRKEVIRPRSDAVKNYMANMGFEEIFMVDKYEPGRPIWAAHKPLTQFERADVDVVTECTQTLTSVSGSFSSEQFGFVSAKFPSNLYHPIEMMFDELMSNVAQHSRSPVGGFIHLQFYPHLRLWRISIADLGISIPTHVQYNPDIAKQVQNDAEALAKAVELGVSGNPQKHSGIGLYDVIDATQQLGGVVRIYSGSAMLVHRKGNQTTALCSHPYPGTILTIDWPLP